MTHGYAAAVVSVLKNIQDSHFKFSITPKRDTDFLKNEIKSSSFITESMIKKYIL